MGWDGIENGGLIEFDWTEDEDVSGAYTSLIYTEIPHRTCKQGVRHDRRADRRGLRPAVARGPQRHHLRVRVHGRRQDLHDAGANT